MRKIIGLLIILLFGLPTLFGIIWAVGITRAAVSPELLSDMPQELIEEMPYFVEEIFEAAKRDDRISDRNTREWLRAMDRADISPREVMEDIGLNDWMRGELSKATTEIGEILRGEIDPKTVVLDFRPLKEALRQPKFQQVFERVVEQLPPCDEDQEAIWSRLETESSHWDDDLPPCQPDMEIARQTWQRIISEATVDMPDDVEIFEEFIELPRGLSVTKFVVSLTYLLFLIPAGFILVGSLIGATTRSGFFRWSGISTLAGALPALGLALLAKHLPPYVMDWGAHTRWWDRSEELREVVFENMGGMLGVLLDNLFTPVIAVAGGVCVVGLILFALSFAFTEPDRREKSPVQSTGEGGTPT
jgi:hypothetical protein